jgi:hypothetical protein
MNSDNLILRETDNLPLINKDDTLTNAEIDGNFINIYNDFISLSQANDPTLIYDVDRTYSVDELATYDGRLWLATEISTGVTPIDGSAEWNDVFPTILAHEKNKDTILDEGGTNETTVAEIRAFIDAGLTSTTNLSLSTKTGTSFKIESSTGADVTIPQANVREAGLLNAEDKVKLDNLEGYNTGDQTLISLNAEDVDNKVTDFTTINDTLYPTTQAVDTYVTAVVPDLVDTFIGGLVAQDLQQVTTEGNTTTDNIEFTGGVGVLFDNTSTLRKGTIDAGYGGAKGIAQICSVGYELKWEAGRLYVMGDGGTTIREVSHNFTTTPSATDDNTKGFIVGSRWILDDGSLYVCTDTTTATAVWVLQTITTADIADSLNKRYVTDANLTTIGNTSGTNTGDQIISDATITTTDITTNNFSTTKHGFVPKGTNVGKYLKDDGTWSTISAGGLTYFTEAQSTASPNATVNVDSLTAVASTTNGDFAIVSKGAGALVRQIPDNTTVGGNKRGSYAVDLGGTRSQNTNVASGSYSSILNGDDVKASGSYSSVLGGYIVYVTGDYAGGGGSNSFIGGTGSFAWGNANTTSSSYCVALGGGHTVSEQYCFAANTGHTVSYFYSSAFGNGNTANGLANFVTGAGASSFALNMRNVRGGYSYTTRGDNQSSDLILSTRTTSATPKVLCSADAPYLAAPSSANQMTLQNNSMMRIKGSISGKQQGSTNVGAWDFDCVIVRGASAASTAIAGTPTVSLVVNTGSFGTPTITADTTIGSLKITVTGVATTNIQWQSIILTSEIIYA